METDVYRRLAHILDTLPAGFPATPNGLEIRILKKIFLPEEAVLFCELRLRFETTLHIAWRTSRPVRELRRKLISMRDKGQIMGVRYRGIWLFKMIPWMIGIYEYQVKRMDRELAEMCLEYARFFVPPFLTRQPQVMKVLPVRKTVSVAQQVLPAADVSRVIERGKSFAVGECVCRREKSLLGRACGNPLEVCLAIAPFSGVLEHYEHWGRSISRQEAYGVLAKAEEAGLVHLTQNVQNGHFFICNCCGCCCMALNSVNEMGLQGVFNIGYTAVIDQRRCSGCGTCARQRCQMHAIEETGGTCRVVREKCIGCGLCASSCPEKAISMVPLRVPGHPPEPRNERAWMDERARWRRVDYSAFR